jgi:hypothetical protein
MELRVKILKDITHTRSCFYKEKLALEGSLAGRSKLLPLFTVRY